MEVAVIPSIGNQVPIDSVEQCIVIRVVKMRWPKYWSFSFNIIPSNEIPGLFELSVSPHFTKVISVGSTALRGLV